MNLIKLSYFLYFIFLPILIFSQGKEANNWYFGGNAGITFNTSPPTSLLDGQLNTEEGCATISDSDGNLLFYTDGSTIYTKSHTIMQNGSGLWGNSSSTQSGVIVPVPNNPDQFYVFTVESNLQLPNTRMAYSLVDLTYNSGLGKVTSKNNLLFSPSSEKIAAVRKTGTSDIWVIGRKSHSNRYSAYLVTQSGVTNPPVYSFIGKLPTEDGDNLGYLKPSADGTKIVNALQNSGIIEIFDFNDQTGVLSNLISLEKPYYKFMYGIEFSPSGRYLYAKTYYQTPQLFQFDLSSGNQTTILNSEYIIETSTFNIDGALQIGSDGRIYSSPKDGYYLGIIENPEAQGPDVIYTKDGIYLGGRKSKLGLPTFIQSYFLASDFTYENVCFGEITQFNITNTANIQSVLWNFDDPSSGSNTSTNLNPTHEFSSAGTYTVTLEMTYPSSVEETEVEIEIFDSPAPDIGNNYTICSGQNLILDPGNGYFAYEWQDGSTNQTYTVTTSGTYSVEVTNSSGCKGSDDAQVVMTPLPNAYAVTGGGIYCEGETGPEIELSDSDIGITYELILNSFPTGNEKNGTGSGISFGQITAEGNYTVKATTNNDCEEMMASSVDVVMILNPILFDISIGGSFCHGEDGIPITLKQSELGVLYKLYKDGNPTIISFTGTGFLIDFGMFDTPGAYTILADKNLCTEWMNG